MQRPGIDDRRERTMARRMAGDGGGDADRPQNREITSVVPVEHVQGKIRVVRGQKVILDADLAELYGVETRVLVQAVKRNIERFPSDFMFQLERAESDLLRSQSVISNSGSGRGGRRFLPYAFTEHGALMAASVLSSKRAVQASVFVVRAFVRLKQMLKPYKELMARLEQLEKKVGDHDREIGAIVEAIRLLMPPPDEPKEPFGFRRVKKN
jgi:hypothetical protein